jgi:putative addiction module component (TIGR02574 family)
MTPRDAVLEQAMNLDEENRAFLADALERSLSTTESVSAEISDAWSQELDRRMAAYQRGETSAVSFEESIEFLRKSLMEHRTQRAKS